MICPRCARENPDDTAKCAGCGLDFHPGSDSETFAGIVPAPIPSKVAAAAARAAIATPPPVSNDAQTAGPWSFGEGGVVSEEVSFGPRYKIQRLLGEGGMGAVYKAYDLELDRTVALKLIRPGIAMDPAVAARFKQELLLASKISHKNILRIHDLGDAGGVKFISMAYVEGTDLHGLLATHGKLPLERAVAIARQLCAALDAAHSEGVVHRDFKPQNILLDSSETVYVSDFGLAKSLETDAGMTRSGEMLGTPRYMAPEQVLGKGIDHRVDIYALGLILYEMLTGDVPFHADSTIQLMYKRVHEAPPSPKTLNPELPDWIVHIILKCIERDPAQRYQSAAEVLRDLENGTAPARSGSRSVQITLPGHVTIPGGRLTLGAAAVLLIAAVVLAIPAVRHRIFRTGGAGAGPAAPVSVLVADFSNHTGDPIFDGTLEPMVNVALEGASFINAYNRGAARRIATTLPHPSDKLDEQSARLVAVSQGIGVVVTGELARRGDGYSISALALDAVNGKVIAQTTETARDKDDVLRAVPKLVAPIREALGDTTPTSQQLTAEAGSFTAASIEVVHQYAVALDQQYAGNMEGALQSFAKAAELDPSFARAYAGMAAMAMNLGKRQDAEQDVKLAMEHVDRMTERERYRIRGMFYVASGDSRKCVDEYSELVKLYPADLAGHANLAGCLNYLRQVPQAIAEQRKAVAISPKSAGLRLYLSFYSSYGGDFAAGEREARTALSLSPSSDGYLALAEAQLGQGQLEQAADSYRKLEKTSASGASLSVSGMADLTTYEGRYRDAAQLLEQGAAADVAAKAPDRAANKFAALAHVRVLLGQTPEAIAAADKALANSQAPNIRFLAARAYLDAGDVAKAQKLASSLSAELKAEAQAYGKIMEGDIALKRGDARAAITALTAANNLLDTWIGRFDLGRAYLQAGMLVEADSEFDRCLQRRGEALELFMDNVPTYGYLPAVYYYEGRVHEGLKSPGFADSYKEYLAIRGKSAEDAMAADARRRIGK
jgi:tetratricopeptide (TPR) repeat protein